MTHHPIKTLPDGTRVYSNGTKYKPKSKAERINGINKPDVEGAVRFHALWFVPLKVLPDDERVMPATRPDDQAYDHAFTNLLCKCEVCLRPQAEYHRRRWMRKMGLRPAKLRPGEAYPLRGQGAARR